MGLDKIEPLDVNNYSSWSISIKALLITKDLWDAVRCVPGAAVIERVLTRGQAATGAAAAAADAAGEAAGGAAVAAPRPAVSVAESNKALAMLLLNVKSHHLSALHKCSSAKEAWDLLATAFRSKSNARRLQLQRELTSIKMEPSESIAKYINRARDLYEELTAVGMTMKMSELVWFVLGGLPIDYTTDVTILTAVNEELSLEAALPVLLLRLAAHQQGRQHR